MAENIQPAERPWQFNMVPIFVLVGWALIMISFVIGLFILTPTAREYWGDNSKVVRDAAGVSGAVVESDDALLSDLDQLASTNRWKEPLTFVGVGAFMVGIALAFSSIPKLLQNRGQVMAVCYKYIVSQ